MAVGKSRLFTIKLLQYLSAHVLPQRFDLRMRLHCSIRPKSSSETDFTNKTKDILQGLERVKLTRFLGNTEITEHAADLLD